MPQTPRPITFELLEQFDQWTRMADMFRISPEGIAFGEEMRDVINLARIGLSKTEEDQK
jgi:hypothetical protein